MVKKKLTLLVEEEYITKARKKGYILSHILTDTLISLLKIPDEKSNLLKMKEEILSNSKIDIAAIDVKLQNLKIKEGISLFNFMKTIEENESYTPKLIETIKFELIESLRIIKENPQTKIARINRLNNKFALKLDLPIVENFLVETDSKESEYYIEKSKSMPRSTNMNGAMVYRKKIVENL